MKKRISKSKRFETFVVRQLEGRRDLAIKQFTSATTQKDRNKYGYHAHELDMILVGVKIMSKMLNNKL